MNVELGLFTTFAFILCWLHGAKAYQLYLQPPKTEQGYFTNQSFAITCITTDESGSLTWVGPDENAITDIEGRIHIGPSQNQPGLELVVESVQKDDAGRYVCSGDQDSIYFDLIVYKSISFGATPKNQHAAEGQNAQITCNVKADPNLVVSWNFNGSSVSNSDQRKTKNDAGLKILNVSRSDAGIYTCKGLVTTVLKSQVEKLDISFQVYYMPEAVDDTESVVYTSIGALTNLSCTISAVPAPMFQWMRNGETIHNSSDFMITNNGIRSVLQLTVLKRSHFGDYICRASNDLGTEEKNIKLEEGDTPMAPHLKVISEGKGTLALELHPEEDDENVLQIIGFKIEYILASQTWDQANSQEFGKGEEYVLNNVSYNTEYHLRATARNAAGYGDYSEEVSYMTQALQVAPVISQASVLTTSIIVMTLMICISWAFY